MKNIKQMIDKICSVNVMPKKIDAHFNDAGDLFVYENMDVSLNRVVTLP